MPREDLLSYADALEANAAALDGTVPVIETTANDLRYRATAMRVLYEELQPPPEPEPEPPPDTLPVFPGVNPMGVVFKDMANVELYAKPTSLLVAGRCTTHSDHPTYRDVRKAGGEVLQYLVATERPDVRVCEKDMEYFKDLSKVHLWPYPKSAPGTRAKYPNSKMTDMTPGSEWILYTVSFIEQKYMRSGLIDGMFMDAVGARPWNAVAEWSTWSLEEKNAYTLGNVDLMRRLDARRKAVNPKFILVNNGVWDRGDGYQGGYEAEKYIDGVMIEHHLSTSAYHVKYAARPFGSGKQRRVLILARTQEDAVEWAKLGGVTHVSGQANSQYIHPNPPAIASWALTDRTQQQHGHHGHHGHHGEPPEQCEDEDTGHL